MGAGSLWPTGRASSTPTPRHPDTPGSVGPLLPRLHGKAEDAQQGAESSGHCATGGSPRGRYSALRGCGRAHPSSTSTPRPHPCLSLWEPEVTGSQAVLSFLPAPPPPCQHLPSGLPSTGGKGYSPNPTNKGGSACSKGYSNAEADSLGGFISWTGTNLPLGAVLWAPSGSLIPSQRLRGEMLARVLG